MRVRRYTTEDSKDREGEWEYTTVVESSNLIVFFHYILSIYQKTQKKIQEDCRGGI